MRNLPSSRIVVADVDAADRFSVELVRNVLLAYPHANILPVGVEKWPKLRAFLADDAQRFRSRTDYSQGFWDLVILGEDQLPVVGDVRVTIALPDVPSLPISEREIILVLGTPEGEVVVVPGTARKINGSHVLTPETFGRLRRAEKIARRRQVRAVILSGWNGCDDNSRSEAVQMLDVWRGPQVPIILDEAARTTAENALWAASLTNALGQVRRVCMVASWVSALRLGLAMIAAFGGWRVRLRLSVVWGRTQAASWRPALVGLIYLRRHLDIGRAFLSDGPDGPDARL